MEVDDTQVAFQVCGDGALDVVLFYGLGSHIDLAWDVPSYRVADGLASVARLTLFDKRGTGASGGSRDVPPTWEQWTADLEAVLDAAESERAAIIAEVDAGPIAMLFAAAHPERVRALVLANTVARFLVDSDYPIGASPQALDELLELVRHQRRQLTRRGQCLQAAPTIRRTSRRPRACGALRRRRARPRRTTATSWSDWMYGTYCRSSKRPRSCSTTIKIPSRPLNTADISRSTSTVPASSNFRHGGWSSTIN